MVDGTDVIAAYLQTGMGSTLSIVGNEVGAATTFNRSVQTATVATTQAPVFEGTDSFASVTVTDAPAVSVAAQVSLTSNQANVGVNATLPLDMFAAQTTNTEIGASLFPGAAVAPVSMVAAVAENAVTADVMGNRARNVLTFGGAALSDVAGASVFSGQLNVDPGDMTALVDSTRVGLDIVGGFLGTASVEQNRVASSSVGNSSVNEIGNSLATTLHGSFTPVTAPTQTIGFNGSGDVFTAVGDYVVGNLQNNRGTAVAATTSNTNIGVALRVRGDLPDLAAGRRVGLGQRVWRRRR